MPPAAPGLWAWEATGHAPWSCSLDLTFFLTRSKPGKSHTWFALQLFPGDPQTDSPCFREAGPLVRKVENAQGSTSRKSKLGPGITPLPRP